MSTLKVDTITDTTGLLAPVFPAGSAQLNPLANREDKIINGDFGVWQRGTSGTANGYTAADRWQNSILGGTVTQVRQTFALGDTLGVSSPIYHLRQTVSGQTLASQYAITQQPIEGVRSYAGQTITVMGWAKRFSGTGNMAVEATQFFGTGGSPSAIVTAISPTTVTLGATWAPFAVVVTVPSVTGKTLGSNGNDNFALSFWTSAGSDFNARTNSLGLQTIGVDLWGIHIRQGTWTAAATADYRPRDPGTELALCQRYYQNSFPRTPVVAGGNQFVFSGNVTAAVGFYSSVGFSVPMRTTPNMTFNQTAVNQFSPGAPSLTGATPFGATIVLAAAATGAGGAYFYDWSADAEL